MTKVGRPQLEKVKDDRISLRINSEDKKKIQIRAIQKGLKLNEYMLYCCLKEIEENPIDNIEK